MLTRPDLLLRLEALLVLVASLSDYYVLHGRWWLFAVLFLVPVLSLAGYMVKGYERFAAGLYNVVHTYTGPLVIGLVGWEWHSVTTGQVALIWLAHIGFDRVLGFGLKYPQAFKPTHIQNVRLFRG